MRHARARLEVGEPAIEDAAERDYRARFLDSSNGLSQLRL
jgi:hypothetical protein